MSKGPSHRRVRAGAPAFGEALFRLVKCLSSGSTRSAGHAPSHAGKSLRYVAALFSALHETFYDFSHPEPTHFSPPLLLAILVEAPDCLVRIAAAVSKLSPRFQAHLLIVCFQQREE